jgi:transcriptional regulator of acetoin/glycerol metabolism
VIFLDEIGEMPLTMQPKLLRVLQDGEIMAVGSTRPERVDVRVLSASNRDLKAAADSGTFRADLYYRLAAFPIALPPLRQRKAPPRPEGRRARTGTCDSRARISKHATLPKCCRAIRAMCHARRKCSASRGSPSSGR